MYIHGVVDHSLDKKGANKTKLNTKLTAQAVRTFMSETRIICHFHNIKTHHLEFIE